MKNLISYLKNVRAELVHVVWPTWQVGVAHTILIILISAVIGVFIAGLDYVFAGIVTSLISQ
jgi:preprotein translocase SecE subunit